MSSPPRAGPLAALTSQIPGPILSLVAGHEIEPAGEDVERWLRVYGDLLRIEGHWTEQVQNDPALWLDPVRTLDLAKTVSEGGALRALCESVAENQAKANHHVVMRNRRLLMYRQLTLILVGLGLLFAALIGLQFVDW